MEEARDLEHQDTDTNICTYSELLNPPIDITFLKHILPLSGRSSFNESEGKWISIFYIFHHFIIIYYIFVCFIKLLGRSIIFPNCLS